MMPVTVVRHMRPKSWKNAEEMLKDLLNLHALWSMKTASIKGKAKQFAFDKSNCFALHQVFLRRANYPTATRMQSGRKKN